jgi:hypothetical protein
MSAKTGDITKNNVVMQRIYFSICKRRIINLNYYLL